MSVVLFTARFSTFLKQRHAKEEGGVINVVNLAQTALLELFFRENGSFQALGTHHSIWLTNEGVCLTAGENRPPPCVTSVASCHR